MTTFGISLIEKKIYTGFIAVCRGLKFSTYVVLFTPVWGAAGRCPWPGTELVLGIRGTGVGTTGRGGWGYRVSGGITGTCCPDAAEALITSSEMISFILITASGVAESQQCLVRSRIQTLAAKYRLCNTFVTVCELHWCFKNVLLTIDLFLSLSLDMQIQRSLSKGKQTRNVMDNTQLLQIYVLPFHSW